MAVEDTPDPDAAPSVDALGQDHPDAAAYRELAADLRDAMEAVPEALSYDVSAVELMDESPGDAVVAPGASCRGKLGDRPGASNPPHPVEKLAEAPV